MIRIRQADNFDKLANVSRIDYPLAVYSHPPPYRQGLRLRAMTISSTTGPISAMALIMPAAQPDTLMAEIDTPSLILDLSAFEDNLRAMQALAERHDVALRPHAKAHRCPEISRRQIALGAQGICCQKVSEAAVFIDAGITDIHISNEIVGAAKLELLARLAGRAQLTVCVDNLLALRDLSDALVRHGTEMGVLVEVDVGQKRCGVQKPAEAVALAQAAQTLPNVTFRGLQGYHGGIQHRRSHSQRREACEVAARRVQRFVAALDKAGIACEVITGGGTGTAAFDAASGVFTEIQPGSYAFMDGDYGSLEWGDALVLRHSLFVLGTVMSTPTALRAVVDIGLKSTTGESGLPRPFDLPNVRCVILQDEHLVLEAESSHDRPSLGSVLRVVPGHCDPTFNLHDQLVVTDQGQVTALWPVSARGYSR